MPELPEVETVRRGLQPALVGARIAAVEQRRPALRFPFPENFAERLRGRQVAALRRRAKYLIADLTSGEALIVHLGMTGRFLVSHEGRGGVIGAYHHEHGGETAHDHVVFHLSNGARVTYNDARRFGYMDLVPGAELETCRHLRHLGVEPLGPDLTGAAIARLFRGRRTPLKSALLDQRLIAGLGNIYVCEALYRAGLSPEAPAGSLADAEGRPNPAAHALSDAIRAVLEEAVAAGGSTLRDYAQTDGSPGGYQNRLQVYDRAGEPCPTPGCDARLARLVQAGRSTFYCPRCQQPSPALAAPAHLD